MTSISRQSLIALGAALSIFLSCAAHAEFAPTAAERANLKVVAAFMSSWNTPDAAVAHLADQASVRMVEDQPAAVGPAAVASALKSFLVPGVTVTVEVLESTVHGPVVLNTRIDTVKTEGKPDQIYPVTGVFVVKNGKIVEWADYLLN